MENLRQTKRYKRVLLAQGVRFYHIKLKVLHSIDTGWATVAVSFDNRYCWYGVSLCAPGDQWNKKKGRFDSLKRLLRASTCKSTDLYVAGVFERNFVEEETWHRKKKHHTYAKLALKESISKLREMACDKEKARWYLDDLVLENKVEEREESV